MGYTTDFEGQFDINKAVDIKTFNLINGLANTRRMKRAGLPEKYGVDGEFYFEPEDFKDCGQSDKPKLGTIVDDNTPPSTQPSLWLQWIITDDYKHIQWDGNEKFYCYVEWLEYIINKILKPRGYVVNGIVRWRGEEFDDIGTITVKNNVVTAKSAKF